MVRPPPRLMLANPKSGSAGVPTVPVPVYVWAPAPANWSRLVVAPPTIPGPIVPLFVKVLPNMFRIALFGLSVEPVDTVKLP